MKAPALLLAALLASPSAWGSTIEPLVGFVENRGQVRADIRFVARQDGIAIAVTSVGFEVQRTLDGGAAEVVAFDFLEGPELRARGVDPLPTRHHFFLGDDPAEWLRDVPGYERVLVDGIASRVQAVFRRGADGFHYDFLVDEGGDPATIRIRCRGARLAGVDEDGALLIETPHGRMRHTAPKAWLQKDASQEIPCAFRIVSAEEYAFVVPPTADPLVIDPGIEWSTYFGGNQQVMPLPLIVDGTRVTDAKVLVDGSTLLTGSSGHLDFPTTVGAFQTSLAGEPRDAFLSRLSHDGSILDFSTFLGGKKFPFPIGGGGTEDSVFVGLGADEQCVIGGFTASADFPSTPGAFNTPSANHSRAFACRLSADGSDLLASALFSMGSLTGAVRGCALNEEGSFAIAGFSNGPGLPTSAGAFDATHNGGADAFVVVLDADFKHLLMGTYVGGTLPDGAASVAYRDQTVVIAGSTQSPDFPVSPNAFDIHFAKTTGFVTSFDVPTGALKYSTFLGGTGGGGASRVALDPYENAYVVGGTFSLDFPTTPGAFMPVPWPIAAGDGFVAALDTTGSTLLFGTYFGGQGSERILDLDVDGDGFLTFVGDTNSDQAFFPTTPGAIQEDWSTVFVHIFVSRLLRDGRTLAYSTAFGGTGASSGTAVDVHGTGAATFAAHAGEFDYPVTPGALDPTNNAQFNKSGVSRIDMLPTGVTRIGTSSPGCAGPLAAGVIANPKAGGKAFEVTCTRGPALANGYLLLSSHRLPSPMLVSGAAIFVDPATAQLVPVLADDLGFVRQRIPLRTQWLGSKGYVQFVFQDPCAPAGWSASTALEIVVQP